MAAEGITVGLVATAFFFGFRHGFDWDHIAAITDITSSQTDTRTAIVFSTLYALGHAAVVFGLGLAAITAGDRLPAWLDAAMGPVVGVTLMMLAVYVLYSLLRHGRDFRMRSRWMLIIDAARRIVRHVRRRDDIVITHEHEHPVDDHGHDHPAPVTAAPGRGLSTALRTHTHVHRHVAPMPDDPFTRYGVASSIGVGMIHGIGAETPTQVVLFLAAAGAGGVAAGIFVLVAFIGGLLASNTLIAVGSAFGTLTTKSYPVYAAIAVATASFSFVLGFLLLTEGG